jgi:uncharacterized delta-60 repeat protein
MRRFGLALAAAATAVILLASSVEAGASGWLVTSFGSSGRAVVPTTANTFHSWGTSGLVARAGSGRIYVVANHMPSTVGKIAYDFVEVTAFTPAGRIDAAFNGGQPLLISRRSVDVCCGLLGAWATASGGVAFGVVDNNGAVVYRLTKSGKPDATFSGDGKARIPTAQVGSTFISDLVMLPNGSFRGVDNLSGAHPGTSDVLVALTAQGTPDTAIGPKGRKSLGVSGADGLASDEDGHVYVATPVGSELTVARFTSLGAPDAGWGTAGATSVSLPGAVTTSVRLALDPADGSVYASVGVHDGTSGFNRPVVAKLTSDGEADLAFGMAGVLLIASSAGSGAIDAIAVDAQSRLLIARHEMPGAKRLLERRLGTTGALDPAFGTGGLVPTGSPIIGITPVASSMITLGTVVASGRTSVVLARRWN